MKKTSAQLSEQRSLSELDFSAPGETLHRILQLSNKLMTPFSVYLQKQHDISVNEFRLLMYIGRAGETSSVEVAKDTGVSTMSVSRAVGTLQKAGRIIVKRDPTNRRRKSLRLTKEGQRLFDIMRPQSRKVADYLLSGLSPDDIVALNRYLETMVNTLDAEDETGRSHFMEYTKPKDE